MEQFQSDGVQIAYIDFPPLTKDRHEPIILIHGFASTHAVNWLFPQWVKTLTEDGRRVVVLDNRGHGKSEKLYEPEAYDLRLMAEDVARLMAGLGLDRADIMGYSMGARIGVHLALAHPDLVRSLILGGIGANLVSATLPRGLPEAMEAERIEDVDDPLLKMFRGFAEATRSDLRALAACARGSGQIIDAAALGRISVPTLVCVGTRDEVAGDPHPLQPLFPNVRIVDIPGRDHNRAVGDRTYKQAVLDFLAHRQ